jgi:16S rRNA (adenine1518-N6/adenine1519-N6)-dimethyltransferase
MPRYLGQHFLNNPDIVDAIIDSANIQPTDIVLEIGPGEGILTEKLCQRAQQVISIELDTKLESVLNEKFKSQKNLEIIFDDILKVNLPLLLKERKIHSYKLVANIPYYITSKIIRLFLETEIQPTEIVLMIQKEVAQRIVAIPGAMSKLSASVQYYARAEILFDVSRDNFDPPPEVDSSVIKISELNKFNKEADKRIFRIIKAGFCARRKTLVNNLANSFHQDKNEIQEKLSSIGLSSQTRAQELSIENWKNLADLF